MTGLECPELCFRMRLPMALTMLCRHTVHGTPPACVSQSNCPAWYRIVKKQRHTVREAHHQRQIGLIRDHAISFCQPTPSIGRRVDHHDIRTVHQPGRCRSAALRLHGIIHAPVILFDSFGIVSDIATHIQRGPLSDAGAASTCEYAMPQTAPILVAIIRQSRLFYTFQGMSPPANALARQHCSSALNYTTIAAPIRLESTDIRRRKIRIRLTQAFSDMDLCYNWVQFMAGIC